MSKKVKYKIVWVLQGWYGAHYGWEDLTAEETLAEIRQRRKEYRENEPYTPFRIIKTKEKCDG